MVTPHLEKLIATLENDKLPDTDKERLQAAIDKYHYWIALLKTTLSQPTTSNDLLSTLINHLNEYRLFIDVELIFDSPSDFLYRQKGQLKLDNSVVEEF